MKTIEIKVIGEIKENSILTLDCFDISILESPVLSEFCLQLPRGSAVVVIEDGKKVELFDETEMNKLGWFREKETSEEFAKKLMGIDPKDHEINYNQTG